MVSVCLPSDALLQHLPSYLGFSYLGPGVSLHGCSSKVQPLLLTLEEGYLLTATLPDLQRGIAPLGPPGPAQPLLLGMLLLAASPGLGHRWLLPAAAPVTLSSSARLPEVFPCFTRGLPASPVFSARPIPELQEKGPARVALGVLLEEVGLLTQDPSLSNSRTHAGPCDPR